MEVAIKLDIPQTQVTQFRLEYWRLQGQDSLESLSIVTKGNVVPLWKLHKELVMKRGMSYERVANRVEIAIDKLLIWKFSMNKPNEQQIDNKRDSTIWKIVYAL